jgi:hypothetical protein
MNIVITGGAGFIVHGLAEWRRRDWADWHEPERHRRKKRPAARQWPLSHHAMESTRRRLQRTSGAGGRQKNLDTDASWA